MTEHVKLSDMSKFCTNIEVWLKVRYGKAKGAKLWEATSRQYYKYLEDLPDYGGKRPVTHLRFTAVSLFSPCIRCFQIIHQ